MKIRTAIAGAMMVCGVLAGMSCTSTSKEQAMNNERSRLQQAREGAEDREDSKQQRKDEERAYQEALRRKS